MNDVTCPNCKKNFKIDESNFADILKQVRDKQFEKEIKNRLISAEKEKETAVQLAKLTLEKNLEEKLAKKEMELNELKSKIEAANISKELEIAKTVKNIEQERDELISKLKTQEIEAQLLESNLRDKFNNELAKRNDIIKIKDEEIKMRKDLKMKLSTKMLGETLEQHCETEFNKLRATGFKNAYFEKDNDSSSGNKGDFIYKEKDEK